MKKTTKQNPQSYFGIANEFSLHTDGRWLTTGSYDTVCSEQFLEVASWRGKRTALNQGITFFADGCVVMSKSPGTYDIKLCDAADGFTG